MPAPLADDGLTQRRLEGFTDPWTVAVHMAREMGKGRDLDSIPNPLKQRKETLADEGLTRRRLEGFTDPWTVSVHKGREMPPGQTLAECGLGAAAAEVVVVRRVLVPESALPKASAACWACTARGLQ